jgi:hypothetical protein
MKYRLQVWTSPEDHKEYLFDFEAEARDSFAFVVANSPNATEVYLYGEDDKLPDGGYVADQWVKGDK